MTENTQLATQTPTARAQAVLNFEAAKAELAELATKSQNITAITNKAGYDECHAARMVLKNKRLDIQKTGKSAREDAQAYAKAVIGVEKDLVGIVETEEQRLQALQSEWDEARRIEREAEERAEAERVQKQRDALAVITGALGKLFGADMETLETAFYQLHNFDMDQFDDVFRPTAMQAREDAIAAIAKARDEREAFDNAAAELRRQQAEQALIEKEQAEARRIQREKEDAERRETQEREDRERADRIAEEDRQRAAQAESERVAREAEEARLAEQRRQIEEQQAAQREAEAKAEQERQEAAQRAEDERLAREQAEAAERERTRAQEAAEAERRAGMLYIIDAPDGSRWSVPVMVIARDRAKHYAHEFDGDETRSLNEDTMPLFESDSFEVADWAANNMNWSDVKAEARIYAPAKPITDEDMQEAWTNGSKEVLIKAVQS